MITIRRSRPLLGTFVEITADFECRTTGHRAISKAFEKIKEIENVLSIHDVDSEISMLNRLPVNTVSSISEIMSEAIRIAIQISKLSGGLFDIVFSKNKNRIPSYLDIMLLPDNKIIFHKKLRLDFGGIGKGFAVDKAVEVLNDYKVNGGSISAGGDIRLFGDKMQEIYIRNPKNPLQIIKAAEVKNGSFATSSNYFRQSGSGCFNDNGIINPKNGIYWGSDVSVSVSAESCAVSDALTKIAALKGKMASKTLRAMNAYGIIYDGEKLAYI
jgi:thiamine biosynthesis lipoprotein